MLPPSATDAVMLDSGRVSVNQDGIDEADICPIKSRSWRLHFGWIDMVAIACIEPIIIEHYRYGNFGWASVETISQHLDSLADRIDGCGVLDHVGARLNIINPLG